MSPFIRRKQNIHQFIYKFISDFICRGPPQMSYVCPVIFGHRLKIERNIAEHRCKTVIIHRTHHRRLSIQKPVFIFLYETLFQSIVDHMAHLVGPHDTEVSLLPHRPSMTRVGRRDHTVGIWTGIGRQVHYVRSTFGKLEHSRAIDAAQRVIAAVESCLYLLRAVIVVSSRI